MALAVVEFGLEAYEGLGDFAGSMRLSSFFFASTFVSLWNERKYAFVHDSRDVDHDVGLTL